jgi:carbon storage regulator
MLVLTRRVGQTIVIDGRIRVMVADVKGDKVRIGIDAPSSIRIDRQEVHERRSTGDMKGLTSKDRWNTTQRPKPMLTTT